MNREEKIEYIAKQLFEQGNVEIIDSAFVESYIGHYGDKKHKGQKFVKQFIRKLRLAIPDIKILKIEFLSQTENTITWQRTFSGTHKTEMQGIPASMKKLKWNEIVVTRFEGERIAEDWLVSDLAFQLMIKQ
ncbi:MAG: ester cyclase, partial [Bacteroidales bacterium]